MSIHVALNHVTQYRYDRAVALSAQLVRLRPAPHCRTRILSYSLRVLPRKHFINWQQDPQANYLARLVFSEPTREFRVEVDLVAEMAVLNPFDFFLAPYAEQAPFEYESNELLDAVFDHSERSEFVYRHVWRVGDLIVWDNRCSAHARDDFPSDQRRLMLRTTVKGTVRPY